MAKTLSKRKIKLGNREIKIQPIQNSRAYVLFVYPNQRCIFDLDSIEYSDLKRRFKPTLFAEVTGMNFMSMRNKTGKRCWNKFLQKLLVGDQKDPVWVPPTLEALGKKKLIKLITLKDMRPIEFKLEDYNGFEFAVSAIKLRQEAIKWIKERMLLPVPKGVFPCVHHAYMHGEREFIKNFFNLTDEDLAEVKDD